MEKEGKSRKRRNGWDFGVRGAHVKSVGLKIWLLWDAPEGTGSGPRLHSRTGMNWLDKKSALCSWAQHLRSMAHGEA